MRVLWFTAALTLASASHADTPALDRLAEGVFVGRDAELETLRAALEESLSGNGRILMLVGEPGIGKTRTSEELCTYAKMRGAQVLWGRCYEGDGAPAYWPWVQIIRSYVHDRDPEGLASEMGTGASDIAEVVSEVRERLPGLPASIRLEPEEARFRLFDSISAFITNASRSKPLVVVLDDLHWADDHSIAVLAHLARYPDDLPLLFIGTYRDTDLTRIHPLSALLSDLRRERRLDRVPPSRLTGDEVGELSAAYSAIRRHVNHLALQDESPVVGLGVLSEHREAVARIWDTHMQR